jgi:hypothetical protein
MPALFCSYYMGQNCPYDSYNFSIGLIEKNKFLVLDAVQLPANIKDTHDQVPTRVPATTYHRPHGEEVGGVATTRQLFPSPFTYLVKNSIVRCIARLKPCEML